MVNRPSTRRHYKRNREPGSAHAGPVPERSGVAHVVLSRRDLIKASAGFALAMPRAAGNRLALAFGDCRHERSWH